MLKTSVDTTNSVNAREEARAGNGTFGEQNLSKPEIALTSPDRISVGEQVKFLRHKGGQGTVLDSGEIISVSESSSDHPNVTVRNTAGAEFSGVSSHPDFTIRSPKSSEEPTRPVGPRRSSQGTGSLSASSPAAFRPDSWSPPRWDRLSETGRRVQLARTTSH